MVRYEKCHLAGCVAVSSACRVRFISSRNGSSHPSFLQSQSCIATCFHEVLLAEILAWILLTHPLHLYHNRDYAELQNDMDLVSVSHSTSSSSLLSSSQCYLKIHQGLATGRIVTCLRFTASLLICATKPGNNIMIVIHFYSLEEINKAITRK